METWKSINEKKHQNVKKKHLFARFEWFFCRWLKSAISHWICPSKISFTFGLFWFLNACGHKITYLKFRLFCHCKWQSPMTQTFKLTKPSENKDNSHDFIFQVNYIFIVDWLIYCLVILLLLAKWQRIFHPSSKLVEPW